MLFYFSSADNSGSIRRRLRDQGTEKVSCVLIPDPRRHLPHLLVAEPLRIPPYVA